MIKRITYDLTYDIRHKVMWPNKSIDFIKVEGDEDADHFGYFIEDKLVSVISVFKTGNTHQFRKFATLENYQKQGIGSKLLTYVLSSYDGEIWCNARIEKIRFYEKYGMRQTDQSFAKGGKEYIIMKKS